jgi:hypothetical protein
MAEYLAPVLKEGFIASPDTQLNEVITINDIPLLKDMLIEERNNVEVLMDTAKRIKPIAQQVIQKEQAYDAAFESEQQVPVPRAGATLQGFAILLLIISYISLILVSVISVNIITGNPYTALKVFILMILGGIILYSLIVRLG